MYFYKKLHFSPFSRRTTGTQCLSRLRQTSGRDAPTAFPTKANGEEFAFRSTGEALQKQANRFTKARKEEIHRSHTTSGKQQRKTQKDPALGNLPGLGPCSLSGRSLPFYFRLANGYRAVLHGTCNILRGRAASFAPTAGTQCLPRLRRSLRKQTARSLLSAPQGKSYGSNQPIVTAQCLTGVLPGRVV